MPRTYVRKTQLSYTPDELQAAVKEVEELKCSYREASSKFGIPASVIYNRIKGRRTPVNRVGQGVGTVFEPEVESKIAGCLLERAKMGFPCTRDEHLDLVAKYIQQKKIKTRFKNGFPGRDWYYGFMSRHPELYLEKAESLRRGGSGGGGKNVRKSEIVNEFYERLLKTVQDEKITNPAIVFSAGESEFNLDSSRLRSSVEEKTEAPNVITGGSKRVSVLACVSADGNKLPPFIVFKGSEVLEKRKSSNSYPGTLYAASNVGWIDEAQFFEWFKDGFLIHIKKLRVKMPNEAAVLIYDGPFSHISVRTVELAIENKIKIIKPSHVTDRIQPLEKYLFGAMKSAWDHKLVNFAKGKTKKGSGRLPKSEIGPLLAQVWNEVLTKEYIKTGFESTGIFPVDATKFPRGELLELSEDKQPKRIQKQASHESESSSNGDESSHTSVESKNSNDPLDSSTDGEGKVSSGQVDAQEQKLESGKRRRTRKRSLHGSEEKGMKKKKKEENKRLRPRHIN